jgi:hypothetical protein
MSEELPENLDLRWLGRTLMDSRREMREGFSAVREDIAGLRRDMDMAIRLVPRVDHTLDAAREDIRSLWLSQGVLRRRLEALESK